jgi:four helix bundle protein
MSIARKEARETLYWLRLAKATGVSKQDMAWEINEAGELRAMIVAAIKTAQANLQRRPISQP